MQHPESILIISLGDCRYETFVRTACPNMNAVGKVQKAYGHGMNAYAAHAALFMGVTPECPGFGPHAVFSLADSPASPDRALFPLEGDTIVHGLKNAGYFTLGTGSGPCFDPASPAGRHLTLDFHQFRFHGSDASPGIAWLSREILDADYPVFAFLTAGKQYPLQETDLEKLDGLAGNLLNAFKGCCVMIFAYCGMGAAPPPDNTPAAVPFILSYGNFFWEEGRY